MALEKNTAAAQNKSQLIGFIEEIEGQLDMKFIAEKKNNPQEWLEFVERGRSLVALENALKGI